MAEDEVKKNVESVFSEIDKFIDSVLKEEEIEERLIDYYDKFGHELRERVGKADNFTGLTEYLLFKVVLMKLKKELKTEFPAVQEEGSAGDKKEQTKSFYSEELKIRLTHDIIIKNHLSSRFKNYNRRPDITVIKESEDGNKELNELVAVFEIKTTMPDKKGAFEKSMNKLSEFITEVGNSSPLIFYVTFFQAPDFQKLVHSEKLEELKKLIEQSKQKMFIIMKEWRKEEGSIWERQISLNEAIEKIVEEIKK